MNENGKHLNEDVLHMLLDGELSGEARKQAETHLAACEACQAEMRGLQALFAALAELAPAAAPDLVPGVLARIGAHRRAGGRAQPRLPLAWIGLALEGGAALAALAWGWAELAAHREIAAEVLHASALSEAWQRTAAETGARWSALTTWLAGMEGAVRAWTVSLAPFGPPHLSPEQVAAVAAALLATWLASSLALLRRTLLNGQAIRFQRRH